MSTTPAYRTGTVSLGLFLGSALVLFALIVAGYAILRLAEPEAFSWAPTLRDRRLGLASGAGLMVALLASAAALRCAVSGRTKTTRVLLLVALVAGAAVIGVHAVEFPAISRRAGLARPAAAAPSASPKAVATAAAPAPVRGTASDGKKIFLGTCAGCHAPDGSGVKGQGFNLRDSAMLKGETEVALLAFVKVGRQPFDPQSKLHLAMPARGGNPALTDQNLIDAVAYARALVQEEAPPPIAAAVPAAAGKEAAKVAPPAGDQPQVIDGELWLPRSILPAAHGGPPGVARAVVAMQKGGSIGKSADNVRRYFSIVMALNALHAIYLLFGLALGVWLLAGGPRVGATGPILAMASAYWLVVALIGMVLLPLAYL